MDRSGWTSCSSVSRSLDDMLSVFWWSEMWSGANTSDGVRECWEKLNDELDGTRAWDAEFWR